MLDAASQPSSTRLRDLTVAQAGALLRKAELTSRELTEDALARIGELDPGLHAFVLVTEELALRQADQADRELRAGLDRGPLHGIGYALKDIFDVAGLPTSNCSWLSVDRVAAQDSTVQARLR
ncbi:MAG TPA: amidase family protein, partial [Jatrophihabitans sp.]|nr:amidase family protein [Jatrophihabitans sp.]